MFRRITRFLSPESGGTPVGLTGPPDDAEHIQEMPGSPSPPDPGTQLVTLKLPDGEKQVSIADIQKQWAGTDRLQEASDARKALAAERTAFEAERAAQAAKLQLADDLARFKAGGPDAEDAFRKVATTVFGVSDEEVGMLLQQQAGSPAGKGENAPNPAGTLLERKHLPPSTQAVDAAFAKVCEESGCTPDEFLGHLSGMLDHAGTQAGTAKIDTLIDQDPVLRVYLNAKNDPEGTTRQSVQAEALRRVTKGSPFEKTAQEVFAEKKAWIQQVARTVGRSATLIPGLGPSSQPGASVLQPTERPAYKPGEPIEKYVALLHSWREAQARD